MDLSIIFIPVVLTGRRFPKFNIVYILELICVYGTKLTPLLFCSFDWIASPFFLLYATIIRL